MGCEENIESILSRYWEHPQFRPVIDQSLVLFLPAELGGNDFWLDRSGYGNNGRIYGAVRTPIHPKFAAIHFDGVDDYVKVPAGFLPTNAITVCLWVRANSFSTTVWRKFLNTGPGTTSGIFGCQISLTSDSWALCLSWDSKTIERRVSIGALVNVWKFVAIGWDGTNVYGGVNGTWSLIGSGGISPDWAGMALYLGSNYLRTENFHGLIDEVQIYNRALSPAEVMHNYTHSPIYYLTRGIDPLIPLYPRCEVTV